MTSLLANSTYLYDTHILLFPVIPPPVICSSSLAQPGEEDRPSLNGRISIFGFQSFFVNLDCTCSIRVPYLYMATGRTDRQIDKQTDRQTDTQ